MSRSTVLSKIELSYPDLLDRRVGSNLFMSSASQPVIAALAAERECSQAMIDTVPASVFVISSEFKLLRFNSTFAEEMDRKLGSQVTAGYDFLSLTGVGNPDRWRDLFARVFAGVPVLERWEVIVPGHSDVIEISAHPISRDSNVTEVAIYIKNLTADVRLAADYQVSMERAKLALESTESLAFDWDLVAKNIELTNLEGIVGVAATQETCTSEWWLERVVEEDRENLKAAIKNAFLGKDTLDVDYRIRHISGMIKDVHTKGAIFRDFNSNPIRAVGITQDITARKTLERELIEARHTADEMNRLKSAFLANMSHEIRTPLTAVIGYADILTTELNGSELGVYSEVICRAGKRLLGTINSLLDLAKIEANMLDLRPEVLSINTLAACIVEELQPIAQERALSLELQSQQSELLCILDHDGVSRVLYNLIGNALKFTTHGGVIVRLTASAIGETPAVKIEVIDSGVGIADVSRIFEPFVQESDGIARKYEGTGLGLSITRKLVGVLDGTIVVDSIPGSGSTFTVLLPTIKSA